jgi:hypothetical protein
MHRYSSMSNFDISLPAFPFIHAKGGIWLISIQETSERRFLETP